MDICNTQKTVPVSSQIDSFTQVSPRLSRTHRSSAPTSGASSSRWSLANGASTSLASRPCQTYENLDFLDKTHLTNSAPSEGCVPPPLPAKSIQRGEVKAESKSCSIINAPYPPSIPIDCENVSSFNHGKMYFIHPRLGMWASPQNYTDTNANISNKVVMLKITCKFCSISYRKWKQGIYSLTCFSTYHIHNTRRGNVNAECKR